MNNTFQQTLARPVTLHGFGIHTATFCEIHLYPQAENTGIRFKVDSEIVSYVEAQVRADARGTQVVLESGVEIMTIEHVIAALVGLGVDNVMIEVDGRELPIKDGSALSFVQKIKEVGLVQQKAPKQCLRLKERCVFQDNDKLIVAIPAESFSVDFILDYNDPLVGTDIASFDGDAASFVEQIAPARTYGFTHEIEYLWQNNKALGATFDNAIVVGHDGYSVPLRFSNELARHKILDFIGDIMALGKLPLAHFIVIRSGHAFNHHAVRQLLLLEEAA